MNAQPKINPEEDDNTNDLDEAALQIARKTLTGDIRDIILNDMKERKSNLPWNMRKEAEQNEVIAQVTKLADGIVTRAVRIVAAGGRKTISAHLKKISIQDDIQATLELSKSDESRHQLIDATGTHVLIVVADPEAFKGEKKAVFASKDQSDIIDPETGEII